MELSKKEDINLTQYYKGVIPEAFFKSSNLAGIFQRQSGRGYLYLMTVLHCPIKFSEFQKITHFRPTTLADALRDFERARLVRIVIRLDNNNRSQRWIELPLDEVDVRMERENEI